ncbi:uncharacterized protein EMH_0003430 [Eimeria mitis]|uniref:Uncharacterized protein n=1 Tax=Eimeria mitis TaxID=44415 RepID=U6JUW3_9EIME|nr:uncharacterized protein EMH_0003430 [Eimeria mitis]CDJ29260.1 hypothetical protein, conserved [Eimeria mitis]
MLLKGENLDRLGNNRMAAMHQNRKIPLQFSRMQTLSVGSKRGRPAASSPPPAKRTKGKVSSAKEHGGVAGHPSVDRGESQQPSGEASGLSPDSWLAPSSVSLPLHSPSYSSLYAPEGGESGPSRQQPDGGYAPQPQHTPPVQQDADASASARPAGVSVDNTLLSIILGYSGAAAPEDRTTTAAAASTASSGDAEGRVDAPGEGETSSPNLAHHRYYRLPSLMRGVRISPFALDSDPEYFIRRSQLMFTCLSTLRELFLKEKLDQKDAENVRCTAVRLALFMLRRLDQKDAENVRCTAVRLALFMLRRHADPLDELSPIKLVSYMGRRYMMLDAIFSAVLVLGPSPEALENWRKFAKQIPTEVNLLSKIGYAAMSDAHMHMLYRLKIALNQLKNGVRPSARDTVELKRFLICDCSHSEFSKRSYLSWKLDDEAFEQGRTR